MNIDITNKNDLVQLFNLLTINSNSKHRALLSNFLEILTVLRGIKPGYIGSKKDFDLLELYNLLPNSREYVYYPRINLIVNQKNVKNLDYDPNTLSTSVFSEDSYKLGTLLGYPCPGIDTGSKSYTSVSFNLITSQMFRDLFNYNDKYTINITGYRCTTAVNYMDLYIYNELLDNYFNNVLKFGKVVLTTSS
jgi:hypothetical protein